MSTGVVTKHLCNLIAKQVEDHRLVVWYDPDQAYATVVGELELPTTTIARYDGSFFQLRHDIDALLNDEQPPRLVVYVPADRGNTHNALIELAAAGVVIQPGQQPPHRNTRLALLARNALKPMLGEETASEIEKQVEAGKLSLADLNTLADKGKDISTGVLSLIFSTAHPQEVALAFLHSDDYDEEIDQKSARKDLLGLLQHAFDVELSATVAIATTDAGLRVVNTIIAANFIRLDEANKAQSMVKDKRKHTFIDKVKVRYLSDDDKHWAELVHFGHRYVHVPEHYMRQYDRLLMGGIWAQVDIRHQYDEEAKGKRSPFWVEDLKPIQVATFDLEEYQACRQHFTADEWIDLLLRSIGMEPSYFDRRQKFLLLVRLLPLCEHNYNLVELGPRGTGKSYAYQELSPYTILLTGPTTVANLFYNMASGKMGLVGIWDVVAFDEVADLQKMPKEVVTTLKTYCESGTFARGKESLSGMASIAMFGNTNQPVEVMVRSSHLFLPMPNVIREDMAFLDRIHFYLPGWEIPKMRVEFFTEHYGFVVDYLAEALRELRKHNYTEIVDHYFSLGSHLNARDVKAVRKTVSGLVKLMYPHGDGTKEALAELVEIALEGRRRVKEQLKKMGSFEYHQTSFSYIDADTRDERYVGVPEEGGRALIASDPLAPGSLYTVSVDDQGKVGLYRLEVGCSAGTGKLRVSGGADSAMRESIQRAFAYIQGHKVNMGIAQAFDTTDFHVEAIDLLTNRVSCDAGIALVIAIYSALKKHAAVPGLLVLGDLSIQGNIKAVRSLAEPLQLGMDNGARRALIPIENKRNFLDVSADIMERVDSIFYGNPLTAAMKALGMN